MAVTQDAINRRVYARADLVRPYARKSQLHAPEAAALVRYS